MKPLHLLVMSTIALSSTVWAQTHSHQPMQHADQKASTAAPADAAEMTDGEVRRIDKEQGKVTLRHGEIKNLKMPGMTMVFRVSDPALLEQVAVGDKVKFHAERGEQGLSVTAMQKQ